MNQEQILGILRHVLTTLGGALVASGKLDPGELETIIGAIMAIAGGIWSWYVKRRLA